MTLSEFGSAVQQCWDDLLDHYGQVELGASVIMPNHVHGILVLVDDNDVGAGFKPAPTSPKRHGLSEIIRAFKTFSARAINELRGAVGTPVWQRGYYERIIRNERELFAIAEYILNNPLKWDEDRENPAGVGAGLKPAPTRHGTRPPPDQGDDIEAILRV